MDTIEPYLPIGSNVCYCVGCRRIFNSEKPFDMHRVDLKCLTVEQMQARGMVVNALGRWVSRAFDRDMSRDAA